MNHLTIGDRLTSAIRSQSSSAESPKELSPAPTEDTSLLGWENPWMTIGSPSETLQWYLSIRNRGDSHTSVSDLLLEKISLRTDARFLPAVLTDFHLSQWGGWCSSWGLSLSEISLNMFKSIGVVSAACRKQGHLHVLTDISTSVVWRPKV